MSESKEQILNRVRNALGKDPWEDNAVIDQKIPRSYNQKSSLDEKAKIRLFAERVSEYKAEVDQIDKEDIGKKIKALCDKENVRKLVIPDGLDDNWLTEVKSSITFLNDSPPLSKEELNSSDAVLTGCFLGIAQTGTIVLDAGPGQGRRVLTLLPDFHICIIRKAQIVGIFPEAIKQLDEIVQSTGRPITMISGPSATSDIELDRVEGVHGPRKLHVLIVM